MILVVVLCSLLFVFGYRFAALGYWFVGGPVNSVGHYSGYVWFCCFICALCGIRWIDMFVG